MKSIRMNLGKDSYDIIVENNALSKLNDYVSDVYTNKNIYIITDSNVGPLYLDKVAKSLKSFNTKSITVSAGEASKSFDVYKTTLEKLVSLGIKRNELLIALGGGVVGDLTGFIAATLYRGIPFIQIPTSLLSQMDSSIGGKTGIDLGILKNYIGAFKQPLRVIIDPNTLDTLPQEELKSGLGELVKHGAIGDITILERLKSNSLIDENIIEKSLNVKKTLVEKDQFDQGDRMLLNFGHTFGHLIEIKENLRHGEAVALGMLMAIRFGIDEGVTKRDCYEELKSLLVKLGMKSYDIDYKPYLKEMFSDKKNMAGKLKFIFISNFGHTVVKEYKESDLI